MKELGFEWDERKSGAESRQAWSSFLRAAEIFANEMLEKIDDREDYGELRFIALGRVETEVYRVVYTWRGEGVVRLISAQRANRNERETYYREIYS